MRGRIFAFVVAVVLGPAAALGQSCPEPLAGARRLALVAADGMASTTAQLQRFERTASGEKWRAVGAPEPVLIGRNGMAWGHAFRAFLRGNEPVKIEGDKRAPAGFYRIGASFGFGASSRPGHLQIREGAVCVDDAASPAYNTITTRARVGWRVHGENMWRFPAYRHGLLVDYPTNAKARAGSCIFIHLRMPDAKGTAGCIALPEPQLVALQDFSEPGAVLAILPQVALGRFPGCLP